jgi:hypothetical protein
MVGGIRSKNMSHAEAHAQLIAHVGDTRGLMSRGAAAHALGGLHLQTISKLARAGKLERVFIGRRSMITVASVEALIESGRAQPTPGLYRRAMAPAEAHR